VRIDSNTKNPKYTGGVRERRVESVQVPGVPVQVPGGGGAQGATGTGVVVPSGLGCLEGQSGLGSPRGLGSHTTVNTVSTGEYTVYGCTPC
jgi:hypothetical protein